jgi:hypothetical protein
MKLARFILCSAFFMSPATYGAVADGRQNSGTEECTQSTQSTQGSHRQQPALHVRCGRKQHNSGTQMNREMAIDTDMKVVMPGRATQLCNMTLRWQYARHPGILHEAW